MPSPMTSALLTHEREYLSGCRFVIDSREKRPLRFKDCDTVVRKLDTGDYSIEGPDGRTFEPGEGRTWTVAVERKAGWGEVSANLSEHPDASGLCRFERELQRASKVGRFAIVIEDTYENLWQHNYNSLYDAKQMIWRLEILAARYRIDLRCVGDWVGASIMVKNYLKAYVYERIKKGQIVIGRD